jgi:hypothetical protein
VHTMEEVLALGLRAAPKETRPKGQPRTRAAATRAADIAH